MSFCLILQNCNFQSHIYLKTKINSCLQDIPGKTWGHYIGCYLSVWKGRTIQFFGRHMQILLRAFIPFTNQIRIASLVYPPLIVLLQEISRKPHYGSHANDLMSWPHACVSRFHKPCIIHDGAFYKIWNLNTGITAW
jgi:hypothetical protein